MMPIISVANLAEWVSIQQKLLENSLSGEDACMVRRTFCRVRECAISDAEEAEISDLENRITCLPETTDLHRFSQILLSSCTNRTITDFVGCFLDGWQSEGYISEAKRRIIECFTTQGVELDLSGLCLSSLPVMVGLLPYLQKLDVSRNQLTELPEVIGRLKQLQSLDCSYNLLTKLPLTLSVLTDTHFICYGNQILVLPPELSHLNVDFRSINELILQVLQPLPVHFQMPLFHPLPFPPLDIYYPIGAPPHTDDL